MSTIRVDIVTIDEGGSSSRLQDRFFSLSCIQFIRKILISLNVGRRMTNETQITRYGQQGNPEMTSSSLLRR